MESGLSKKLKNLIFAVTIGGILEWYEIFLYVYWAPEIADLFFSQARGIPSIIDALLVFAFGFLARPIGGLLFGYIGDRYGRKISFLSSIIFCSLPSFIVAFLPTYAAWGVVSQLILSFTRFLQGIPAGGELPGAICYLYESASKAKKNFITSFSFIGAQIGGIIGLVECVFFEKFMTQESLLAHGWRLSFAIGGLIGLLGFFLRYKMHESPEYIKLEKHDHILKTPIKEAFLRHKKEMLIGAIISTFEVVGYFIIAVFPAVFYGQIFGLSTTQNLLTTATLLSVSALSIPFVGKLGDRFGVKGFMFWGSIISFGLTIPLFFAISNLNFIWTMFFQLLLVLSLSVQFAFIPGILADLFPTSSRFTCLGFSFNVCDSVLGGLTPVLAICCINYSKNPAAFVVLITAAALLNIYLFSGKRSHAIFNKKLNTFFTGVNRIRTK